jgi:hypothetical protein
MQQIQSPQTTPTTRVPKPDELRLRRRVIINMTRSEFDDIRRASLPEPVSSYVRAALREKIQAQS